MKPTIYLALTHDWELRGDGSGDIEQIQFAPMRELLRIYKEYGIRTTFHPDVTQQLSFRKFTGQTAALKSQADQWDEHLRKAFRLGHDIQLHIHPQWWTANYKGGKWQLSDDWSILDYDPDSTLAMLTQSKDYLETLLQKLDSSYRCLAFRAGALAIAPSSHLLRLLARLGIVLDVSVAPGLKVDTTHVQFDYRSCEGRFLPFYPRMDDARRISDRPEGIICVPIHCFYGSRLQVLKWHFQFLARMTKQRLGSQKKEREMPADVYANRHWREASHSSLLQLLYHKVFIPYLTGNYLVSNTARLNYPLLREMLASIRRHAQASGKPAVPAVITNHPKEIRSFTSFERFIRETSQADDIKFITLTEMARKLLKQELPVTCQRADTMTRYSVSEYSYFSSSNTQTADKR